MKLSDVDALEMARQLTLMESHLYQKIRPIECLQRSRDSKGDINDNISAVIRFANKISDWVAETILARDDSRRRASVVKNFIAIADVSALISVDVTLGLMPVLRLAMQDSTQLPIDACHCRWSEHDANPSTKADMGTSPPAFHDDVVAVRDHAEYQQKLWQLPPQTLDNRSSVCPVYR